MKRAPDRFAELEALIRRVRDVDLKVELNHALLKLRRGAEAVRGK